MFIYNISSIAIFLIPQLFKKTYAKQNGDNKKLLSLTKNNQCKYVIPKSIHLTYE